MNGEPIKNTDQLLEEELDNSYYKQKEDTNQTSQEDIDNLPENIKTDKCP